jgi:uncharacterized protein
VTLALLVATTTARADVTFPTPPPEGIFVVDEADLVSDDDETAINADCATLLEERRIPIIVVTIPSLDDYDAGGLSVDRYATRLFDEWGIGWSNWNYGMLLLVSKGDRGARIELGAEWGRDHDPACEQVMDDMIIPNFKVGEFSAGVRDGVRGIAMIARDEPLPTRRTQPGGGFFGEVALWMRRLGLSGLGSCLIVPVIVIGIIVSMLRRFGRGGRIGGWASGGYVGGSSFGGGGFSGGGGGFSGGGGASGSW